MKAYTCTMECFDRTTREWIYISLCVMAERWADASVVARTALRSKELHVGPALTVIPVR